MTEHYPRIRVRAEGGMLLVREGLSLHFHMRRSHEEVAPSLLRALETYVKAVGPETLRWYYDPDGEPQPLDEHGWEQARRELLGPGSPVIQLDDDSTENRYRFEYHGKDLKAPAVKRKPDAVCSALFWLPTEFLEEHGPERVRELASALAAPLPLGSGHGGLSFNADYSLLGARHEVAQHWLRYPGFDVYDSPNFHSWKVGTRVRGPHWLTFLGQPVLGALGGAEGLRSRLQSPGTTVQELAGDKVLITLGAWPEAGDTQQGDTLPAYRELARVLEPWLYVDEDPRMLGQSEEDTRRWKRRFLD
ncbi:DUF3396 domain-containing protein [Hyalangium minutum]|uniref:DUF3396 domain-containing protein n=1 Tax=Hyalangium minutum TaxID=394096 RepID=A0A085WEX7_9BACT|nr:DUF3396 domain-containing protein [Hyalangium minutum]KFE66240.1 hypothetical protein DB31_1305 [Hyalangium minutum]